MSDSEKQAWPCHTEEIPFCLSKSGQKASLIFAKEVVSLVYSLYGCYMESLISQEWTRRSEGADNECPVEEVMCSPVWSDGGAVS